MVTGNKSHLEHSPRRVTLNCSPQRMKIFKCHSQVWWTCFSYFPLDLFLGHSSFCLGINRSWGNGANGVSGHGPGDNRANTRSGEWDGKQALNWLGWAANTVLPKASGDWQLISRKPRCKRTSVRAQRHSRADPNRQRVPTEHRGQQQPVRQRGSRATSPESQAKGHRPPSPRFLGQVPMCLYWRWNSDQGKQSPESTAPFPGDFKSARRK